MGKKRSAIEEKPEPCSLAGTCVHAGEDCTDVGKHERESQCYEEGENAGESSSADGALAAGEDVASNEVEKQEEGTGVPDWWPDNWSKPFNRLLPVKLTQDELAEYSKEQSQVFREWQCIRLAKKAYDKKANDLIEEHEEKLDEIAVIVSSGAKQLPVECYTAYDAEHGIKRVWRTDNFDIIEESAMTTEELQKSFDFQAEKSAENAEALRQEQATGEAGASESGEPDACDMAAFLDEEGAGVEDFEGVA